MTSSAEKAGARKRWKYAFISLLTFVLLAGTAVWYTTTDSFQAMVRRRLVAELERATGGQVELGGFHVVPFQFRVDVRDITIHGLEKPEEIPYAHVDRLVADVKVISVLGFEFGFNRVVLERPVVHIIVNPDGTTNQPEPKLKRVSDQTPVEDLFSLSIARLEVRRGELLLNDQKIPLDFLANDVSADLSYSVLHRRYESQLLLGKVDTRFRDYRPLAWTAEAQFSLRQNNLELKSLKASSGRSHVTASGRIDDFRNPRIEGTYDLSLDLGEFSAIMRRREVERGILQAKGSGRWSLQDFASEGKFQIAGLDWQDKSVTVRKVAGSGEYSINPKRLALAHVEGKLLGGTVTGDADLSNWLLAVQTSRPNGKKVERQAGVVRLKLDNLAIRDVGIALSTMSPAFERVKFAGGLNGTVESRWATSPHAAETTLTLDIVPPAQAAAGQLPLTARLRATYSGTSGDLTVSDFAALTLATKIRASGTLTSRAAVKVSASTSDLDELSPILAALGYRQVPVTVHGRASFNGTVSGRVSDPTVTGDLHAQDFDVLIPARSGAPARSLHWDWLHTNVQISPHGLALRNGDLRRGPTTVAFDLSTGLQRGQVSEQSPFIVRLNMRNADVAEILSLAGYQYPIAGTMNLSLHAGGTRADPNGEGRLEIANARVYGEPVDRMTADLHVSRGAAAFNNIQLEQRGARVTGGGTYEWAARNFHFNLQGRGFELTQLPVLQQSRVPIGGRMDFTAEASGTPDAPVVNAKLTLHDLSLDRELAGDFIIDAVTQGPELRLTGRSQFPHSELNVDGNIHLRGDWPSNINLHFNHFDIDSLLRTYLKGRVTGHSALAGDIALQGPLRRPDELNVRADISDLYADVENIKLRNDGPLQFAVTDRRLHIDRFRLVGEGTDLSASGTMQLAGERALDLRAQGHVNLQLIGSFDPDFTSSGIVAVDMTLGGTLARPITQGRVQITKANIAYVDLPSALSDMNGSLILNQDRLQIESLSAHTGGGLLNFSGYATVHSGQINFNLGVQGREVRLRYPPGFSSTANADVQWVGTPANSTLSGDITVTRVAITPGFDFAAYLERMNRGSALPTTSPLLSRIRLDVHFVTTPDLQMQTAAVRLSGDADLRLRGTAAKPVLIGRADVLEGEIYFNGAKYRLERGDVSFSNPVTTTPVVDLQASTHVRDYDISINLNGPPDKLHVTYRSEPPLPEADIIALLALGRTQEESAQLQRSGQTSFSQETSNAILAGALNATVSNRVQRLFGGSRIKIDPQGLSTETSPVRGPQVTIEQQVVNNFTVTYSTNVSQASQQIIQVEYNVTRNVSVVAIRDQNGVVSFDVRIRQRKK